MRPPHRSVCYQMSVRMLPSFVVSWFAATSVHGEDWPTWRHDAARSGSSTEQLPRELHPQSILRMPELKPAWNEDERLQFDAHYEPIVAGNSLFVASPLEHTLQAFDFLSGRSKWLFFANAPVRFAPTHADGKLFFGSDDGYFYCLNAEDGSIAWKFNAAPTDRMAVGNEKLVSVWPVWTG